jgi:outer membrane protein with beta-barrel domain
MKRTGVLSALLIGLVFTASVAIAGDPLGAYIGGAVGQSLVRGVLNAGDCIASAFCSNSPQIPFARHATGWKVLMGIRPLAVLGAEVEYVDFGSSRTVAVSRFATTKYVGVMGAANAHQTATAAFAVAYLPIPIEPVDFFAKIGGAALRSDLNFSGNYVLCTFPIDCFPFGSAQYAIDRTTAHFAYGGGVQLKIAHLRLRAEYERVSAPGGDPQLLSLGLFWAF